jgi:hypothetical protein
MNTSHAAVTPTATFTCTEGSFEQGNATPSRWFPSDMIDQGLRVARRKVMDTTLRAAVPCDAYGINVAMLG